jgi:hypothetical protein
MSDLIVREPFGGHRQGDRITNEAEVKAILDGPQAHHVIAVAPLPKTEDAPTPKPTGKSQS